jgi:thioredoxin reductase (NADPH)
VKQLTVLSRSYCHLCDDMIAALRDLQSRLDYTFDVVDIDQRPELEANWGDKVPVLLDGEVEICHFFLDQDRLALRLAATHRCL